MTLLDRYLLRHFLISYAACFLSVLALYVVIDLFTRLDEFTDSEVESTTVVATEKGTKPEKATEKPRRKKDTVEMFASVGSYYLYRLPLIFDRLSSMMALMAATFTLGWLERQNEILPCLAAGVSMRRLLLPIWIGILTLIGLGICNREWLVPHCAPQLLRSAEDSAGKRPVLVQGRYDSQNILFEGRVGYPERQMVQYANITLPSRLTGGMVHLNCKEMFYRPAQGQDASGWYLMGCTPATLDPCPWPLQQLGPGQYFLFTDMSYDRLSRRTNWFMFQSTEQLLDLLRSDDQFPRRSEVIALVHQRFTEPALEFLMLVLGVALVIGRPDQHLFIKLGGALILFGLYYGLQLLFSATARTQFLDPVLSAWLPVFLFGPLSFVMLDGMRS
jgi:lipopolysaccharide export system permease protein